MMIPKRSLRNVVVLFVTVQQQQQRVVESFFPSLQSDELAPKSCFIQPATLVFSLDRRATTCRNRSCLNVLPSSSEDDDEEDDDAEEIDLSSQDWRTFRAKLVMGSTTKTKKASAKPTTLSEDILSSNANNESSNNRTNIVDDFDGIGAIFAATNDDDDIYSDDTYNDVLTLTPLDPSQWAYDSGKVIERGAVILGGVEQDFGFGLRQQYFHKAAILVIDHDESVFTKGIILNRPTDLTLDDSINPSVKWRVWYGGDVQGLHSSNPEVICLHTLKGIEVTRVSIPIINDLQWTTFDVAKTLVKSGAAKSTDFWVFCGYAGWGPKQLMGELERKSWYMVTTDSQTLLKELARLSSTVDPRDAGLETWSLLMSMIGRSETAAENTGDFDDHMLKEWALKHLLSVEAGGGAETTGSALLSGTVSPTIIPTTKQLKWKEQPPSNPFDRLLKRVSATSSSSSKPATKISVGTVVRASSADRSPFLLDCQELHKSLVLIVADDENFTAGVILNRPGAKGIDVQIQEKGSSSSKLKSQTKVPLRYGGQLALKGSESLMWLHCNPILKEANIGKPVGTSGDGIWSCKADDVILAIRQGLVSPNVFVVVAGLSIWMKGVRVSGSNEIASQHGIQGEITIGNYEIVPNNQISSMFDELIKQEVLSEENLNKNLILAEQAWHAAAATTTNAKKADSNGSNITGNTLRKLLPIGGLGEGYDEDDDIDHDTMVYQTNVKVSKLSDDALRSWVATFLLGAPSLGE